MKNGNEPATRQDLAKLKEELAEVIHDSETRILQAFFAIAESNQKRLAEIETENAFVKSRLSTLEQRVLEVEKRLHLPPTQ